MKIAFLDIDGVLTTSRHFHNGHGKEWLEDDAKTFDPICVGFFNSLLEKVPDLKIVISSCWRSGRTVDQLRAIFKRRGIECDIIGKTKPSCVPNELRGMQCFDFLKEIGGEHQVVFIDDDHDFLDAQLNQCVFTSWKLGFEERHIGEIIEKLEAQK